MVAPSRPRSPFREDGGSVRSLREGVEDARCQSRLRPVAGKLAAYQAFFVAQLLVEQQGSSQRNRLIVVWLVWRA